MRPRLGLLSHLLELSKVPGGSFRDATQKGNHLAPRPIRTSQMGPMLVEACPSFEPEWKQFLAEWIDEPEPPIYLAHGDFARHLSGLFVENNHEVPQRFQGRCQRCCQPSGLSQFYASLLEFKLVILRYVH